MDNEKIVLTMPTEKFTLEEMSEKIIGEAKNAVDYLERCYDKDVFKEELDDEDLPSEVTTFEQYQMYRLNCALQSAERIKLHVENLRAEIKINKGEYVKTNTELVKKATHISELVKNL